MSRRDRSLDDGMAASSRREFCGGVCHAASALAALALVQACGGSPSGPSGINVPQLPTIPAQRVGGLLHVPTVSTALAEINNPARVVSTAGSFLVTRTGENTFVALTATCTHEQFTISGIEDGLFVCTNHGSRFTPLGQVVNGPAIVPLRNFATTFNDDVLTIVL